MIERPSPNFDARPPGSVVDMLVLHYTGMASAEAALDRLCDPAAKVGAHYVIDEDGTVSRLVDEDRRAWHAGASSWRGVANVNARSIGIELANPGHDFGCRPFAEAQMVALADLAADVLGRHPIPARNVVGHSDVAPRRRMDPGELFDWRRLARAGIGLWPVGARPGHRAEDAVTAMLAEYGYETEDQTRTLEAFQRHFRPARIDGLADAETAGLAEALLDQCD